MEVTVLYLDEAEDTQVRECEATEAVCAGGEIQGERIETVKWLRVVQQHDVRRKRDINCNVN